MAYITSGMIFPSELRIDYNFLAKILYYLNQGTNVRLRGLDQDVVLLCQQGEFVDMEKIIEIEQQT